MRCRQCGYNVENDKAFCPVCGSPMKVTADYEYIQAEIANKVDRYINDNENESASMDRKDLVGNEIKGETDLTVIGDGAARTSASKAEVKPKKSQAAKPSSNDKKKMAAKNAKKGKSSKRDIEAAEEVSRTKDLKIRDSVYDENGKIAPKKRVQPQHPYQAQRPPKPPVKTNTTGVVITCIIIVLIIAAAVLGILAVLGTFDKKKSNSNGNATDIVSTNIIDGRTYEEPLEIILSSSHGNAIYYTIDGTAPSPNTSRYNGPFNIFESDVKGNPVTLRAITYQGDSAAAGELIVSFYFGDKQGTIKPVNAPLISPDSGSFSDDTNIYVSSADNGTIYYTYDGSMPNEDSDVYNGPVPMKPGTRIFRAVSIANGIMSEVAEATFTLEYDVNTSSNEALENVIDDLRDYGYISDADGNTYDGGKAVIDNLGIYEIGQYTYYVFQVDFFNADGSYNYTIYRGVGTNYGSVYEMGKDGDSYYVN